MVQQFPKDLQSLMHRVIRYHLLCHLDRQHLMVPLFRCLHLDLLFRLDLRHRRGQHLHLFLANLGYLMARLPHLVPLFRLHLLILKHRVILTDRQHLMVPHLR